MSKQRKFTKHSNDLHRWVPKKKQKEGAVDSLTEFCADWPSLPDESASNLDYYFNSYAHFGIHEDMLKDSVRTGSYMRAILQNAHLFKGKTVLDVGSGTGILCLFAAKAGAKRCIGVECSEIADYAAEIARKNGYDNITYVRGKVEEVELPAETVDIIVSEWMGYFLIYESMLDSVLFARDKWLVNGGLLFPDHAKLFVAGIEDADYKEEKVGFWSQVWGFDFSPMKQCVTQEPITDTVDDASRATSTCCLLDVDLHAVQKVDLDFASLFTLKVLRKDFVHALVVWFEVSFDACSPPVVLSTEPGLANTHWKQTVLYLEEPLIAQKGDAVSGTLAVRKSKLNPRDLDVKLSLEFDGFLHKSSKVQFFRLR